MASSPARALIINEVLAAAAGRPISSPLPSSSLSASSSVPQLGPSSSTSSSPKSSKQKNVPGMPQVYSVRAPKFERKKYNIMRFNGAHKIDFNKWKACKMQREDNSKSFAPINFGKDDMPKFGAGSEYGRDKREAARRRKYGMYRKKYKPQDQPWILKLGENKLSKRFKGTIEGGVNDNASYYVFTHNPAGHFDVFPIHQWINFTPIQTYKSLSAEEAEEEFGRRNKVMNLFTVMVRKRMKVDDVDEEEQKGGAKGKSKDSRALKMSEMDDWDDDDDDDDEGSDDNSEKKPKKKDKKKPAKKPKKKKESDDEPLEDSDDGDEEGLELDYISDSSEPSEDEDDKKPELAGVDQEKSGLLESESSEDESQEKKKEEQPEAAAEAEKKKKQHKKKKEVKEAVKEDSESSDNDDNMPDLKPDDKKSDVPNISMDIVDSISTEKLPEKESQKRKATFDIDFESTSKKSKLEVSPALLQLAASEGITEEAVRKYLLRKPMTVYELLQKFKPKKTRIPNEDMVPIIAHILKKINPSKRTNNLKLYFFLNS